MTAFPPTVTRRELALLHAIADGRAQMTRSREPDLFVDGLASCDQEAARHLSHAGLVEPVGTGPVGSRCAARLTALGATLLAELPALTTRPA
ncbi:hypothetical protein ACFWN2_44700 [Lentzea sp. NPDC058436]|uniref:hypothetical protein n=1 Tax=Lentzea sp. NPDC058436 TaxID=3346499 RepID=UPI00365F2F64